MMKAKPSGKTGAPAQELSENPVFIAVNEQECEAATQNADNFAQKV
ncbi:hypothetical protein ACNKHX_22425 [Shigella flexneri]